MAITNLDTLIGAMANAPQNLHFHKLGHPNSAAGQFFSMWASGTVPAAGAAPTTPAICTKDLVGAVPFVHPTGGKHSYIAQFNVVTSLGGNDIQFHDRLAHMGGLSANTTASQTVDLDASGTSNNLVNRRGASDYSDVQWWLEWYVQSGSTATTPTVTYTNAAGETGRTLSTLTLGTNIRVGRMVPLIGAGGEFIKSVQSVQLNNATGIVGNFGVTATRSLWGASPPRDNVTVSLDFQRIGLPRIHDEAALFPLIITGTTSTGSVFAVAKMIQG